MEENKNYETESQLQEAGKLSFDFQTIYTTIVLNWKWFVLSLLICLGVAFVYLRYTTPIYQAYAKLLIKDDSNNMRSGRNSIQSMSNLGIMSNSERIDNELEILKSRSLAEETVRDLKLYVNYRSAGKIKDRLLYRINPIEVDLDPVHLDKLDAPINLLITREKGNYRIKGSFFLPGDKGNSLIEHTIDKTISMLPATVNTKVGLLTFNSTRIPMNEGSQIKVSIASPKMVSYKYAGSLSVSQTSKTTTIAQLVLNDENAQRAVDYLQQLAVCYNRLANEDKNEIAIRTEKFINERLEKINAELGSTEGQLENYKRANRMVELKLNAGQAMSNVNAFDQKLTDINTQIALLNSVSESMRQPANKYQTLPAGIGISDASVTGLINQYNTLALERNRMLRSASENSPVISQLTSQLDELSESIHRTMGQVRRNLEIQRNSIAAQYGKAAGQISETPEQERMLTQIGRQQEVKSGLYLMLLQKREENSIALAATADKGKLIDNPQRGGRISPKTSMVLALAIFLGLAIPAVIFFILQLLRYKIEGHDDVVKLTTLPILADVAIASEAAKTKADIVVHENKNNQMEEIFRSMRTNLQFLMKENDKVILFTSSTSGEGKTFNAANLAVSFALLGKKVLLVGLDIRKPRLAELFEINDYKRGITQLLPHENITLEMVNEQIMPSGINNNLDLLLAGTIPPNPAELVARPSLNKVFEILREHYDYILIDSAPVGLVTDTLQIGRIADTTVYMCRADYTTKESFNLINSLHKENKLPNMAIVLNGIDMSKKKYGYYYGYGKYGYYSRYGRYGKYKKYGSYGSYGQYGSYYGNYGNSHYGDKNDNSVKH